MKSRITKRMAIIASYVKNESYGLLGPQMAATIIQDQTPFDCIVGFIHPTPWDTSQTSAQIKKNIYLYGLQNDILPPHSTPLIIHHASGLGDWIREIERREGVWFKRYGSIIGWWETPRCYG
jgi:hypothetical protein